MLRRSWLAALAPLVLFQATGCGSLIYNCKANDTQCKEKVAAMDRATAEIAIDVTAAAIEASAKADSEPTTEQPKTQVAATSSAVPCVAPAASSAGAVSDSSGAPGATGPAGSSLEPFDAPAALRELHVAVHFAKMCRGDSTGAVSGKVVLDPRGLVRVRRITGPGIKDKAVARCVTGRIELATIKPFHGPERTASILFDVDPDEDLPTPKEAEASTK